MSTSGTELQAMLLFCVCMYCVIKDNVKLSEMFKVIFCDADVAQVEYSSKNLSILKSPLRELHKANGPFNVLILV